MAKDFEELDCWQLARELRRRVRAITEYPAARRDFDFCDDIRRSGRSAPANIAEGFRRRKPKVFAHFLDVALGSIAETKNHLGEALEAKYIGATEHAELVELAERAKRASQGLQAYLERCGKNPPRTATPRSRRPARFDGSNKPNRHLSNQRAGNSTSGSQTPADSEPRIASRAPRPRTGDDPAHGNPKQ